MKSVVIHIRINFDTRKAINQIARLERRNFAQQCDLMLYEWLRNRQESRIGAARGLSSTKKVSEPAPTGNRAGSGLSAVLPQKRANHDAAA